MKITNLKKNERRAFMLSVLLSLVKSSDKPKLESFEETMIKACGPKARVSSTQRDRTERRRQSWIADADNDRHTKALNIFRRRL